MKVLIVITDKSGEFHSMAVNAVSLNHAIKKAEIYSVRSGIWKKRIQAFDPYYVDIDTRYKGLDFPLVRIK